jgi:undecaprenyl-diphosphatase
MWRTITTHKWQLVSLFFAVLLPLLLFGLIAEDVLEREQFFFDAPLLLYFHRIANPAMNAVMVTFSRLGYQWGVVPVDIAVIVLLLYLRRQRDTLFFGLSVGGGGILNQVAKTMFGRERPTFWESIAPEPTLSFPSGHAMGSMALVVALVVLLWPTRWRLHALILGIFFVVMVGLSRVYLGVHYPSDVLAGWAASLAWVMGLSRVLYGRLGKPTPATQHAQASLSVQQGGHGSS